MGLLDKPLVAQEVLEIRRRRYNNAIKKKHLRKMGLTPFRKYRRKKFKREGISKNLRKEWA